MSDITERRHDVDTPFPILVREASDFDLVNAVFQKISNKYDSTNDVSCLSLEQRIVSLVWHASGIIDNGGFEYLLSYELPSDPDLSLTIEAHKSAGLVRSYDAFQQMLAAFPNCVPPSESESRIQEYKRLDSAKREEINRLYWVDGWEKTRETKLAEFIRLHPSTFTELDLKVPGILSRTWDVISKDEFILSLFCGVLAGCIGTVLSSGKTFIPWVGAIAASIGFILGWLWGYCRRWCRNHPFGDKQNLLDVIGRELLTFWIPLNHELNDDDVTFARSLGQAVNDELKRNAENIFVRYVSVETSLNAVGVRIKGQNPEDILSLVRPFFQSRCPAGSYVTRMRLCRDDENPDDPAFCWPGPRPLFEGEEIIAP